MTTTDVQRRMNCLNSAVERIAGGQRLCLSTDDPQFPVYVTTHFDKPYAGVLIATQCAHTSVEHRHAAREWVFVLNGRLEVVVDGITADVLAGCYVEIPADAPHGVKALEDSQYVVISMPNVCDELPVLLD